MKFSEEFKKTKEYQSLLESNRRYYLRNKEKRKAQMRERWEQNKDKMKDYKKTYYEKNKEKVKLKTKEYRLNHKDQCAKKFKEYYNRTRPTRLQKMREYGKKRWKEMSEQDKAEYRAKKREWENEKRKTDLNFAIKKRLRLRVWQAFKGIRKKSSDELGIDYSKIVEQLNKTLPADYNDNPSGYEIDHIKPLCSFDLTNDKEVLIAFAPENHKWMKVEEHLPKSLEDRKQTIHVPKKKNSKECKEKKEGKEVPYMQKENLDTTFSSLWLYRANNPDGNKFKNIVLADPIGNMEDLTTVRTKGGINYYSKFNPILADNIVSYWSKEGDVILDPFSGRTRAIVSAAKNRKYYGFEIAPDVHKVVLGEIAKNKQFLPVLPEVYNDDSANVTETKYNIPAADLIFSCPPYFNIEKYPSCKGQLSDIEDYQKFLEAYQVIMTRCCSKLKVEGYAALVVGDFRIGGRYYCFMKDTIEIMEKAGVALHDVIVRQSVTFDRATVRFGSSRKTKTVAKVHEYILIFKKLQ